jgi:hypothetical protein
MIRMLGELCIWSEVRWGSLQRGNDEYKKNEISSVTRMLINQATLTIKTQELLLEMLERVDKICDALEGRND